MAASFSGEGLVYTFTPKVIDLAFMEGLSKLYCQLCSAVGPLGHLPLRWNFYCVYILFPILLLPCVQEKLHQNWGK